MFMHKHNPADVISQEEFDRLPTNLQKDYKHDGGKDFDNGPDEEEDEEEWDDEDLEIEDEDEEDEEDEEEDD